MEWLIALPFFVGAILSMAGVDFTDPKMAEHLNRERENNGR